MLLALAVVIALVTIVTTVKQAVVWCVTPPALRGHRLAVHIYWREQGFSPAYLAGDLENRSDIPLKDIVIVPAVSRIITDQGFRMGRRKEWLDAAVVEPVGGYQAAGGRILPWGAAPPSTAANRYQILPGERTRILLCGVTHGSLADLDVYVMDSSSGRSVKVPIPFTTVVAPEWRPGMP